MDPKQAIIDKVIGILKKLGVEDSLISQIKESMVSPEKADKTIKTEKTSMEIEADGLMDSPEEDDSESIDSKDEESAMSTDEMEKKFNLGKNYKIVCIKG